MSIGTVLGIAAVSVTLFILLNFPLLSLLVIPPLAAAGITKAVIEQRKVR